MSDYIHLRGREALLEHKEALTTLGRRLGIRDAGAQVSALLTGPSIVSKIPHLILPRSSADGDFAVLLREYSVAGVPSGILIPMDHTGELTMLAPGQDHVRIAAEVLDHLLRRNVLTVLLSLSGVDLATEPLAEWPLARYATQTRHIRRSLTLGATLDETLGSFGARTRRNLRHYARLAASDLEAVFHSDQPMSEQDFLALNRSGSHLFSERVARWLYRSSKDPNRFLVAVRIHGDRYISALGGRHFEDQAIVDWQINDAGLKKYSVSTVMRALYLQYEVERGTKLLSFECGTPHSMQHSFFEEPVTDVLAIRQPFSPRLLRRAIAAAFPEGNNFMSYVLLNGRDTWR